MGHLNGESAATRAEPGGVGRHRLAGNPDQPIGVGRLAHLSAGGNLTDILRQVSLIGIISLAMTFVILTGGIDLSVGSVLALSTTLVAMGLTRAWQSASYSSHIVWAILAAVAACTLAGALNGVLMATLRIQPFVVTLASMIGMRGLAKWLSNNENIDIGFGRDVAAKFAAVFREKAIVIGSYACGGGAALDLVGAHGVRPARSRDR